VNADFRGQNYSLDNSSIVFNAPGLHIFPGQTTPYPAEIHIHMTATSSPQRGITIVVPASHLVDPASHPGQAYFSATSATGTTTAPVLSTIIPQDAKLLMYRGPDIRGRTAATPNTAACAADSMERMFLLVLDTAFILATDLYRIPSIGAKNSTDPRDLPALGIAPSTPNIARNRLLRCITIAYPGIVAKASDIPILEPVSTELECKPLRVVDGRDVVDDSAGKSIDLATLLGYKDVSGAAAAPGTITNMGLAASVLLFIGTVVGLFIADFFIDFIWRFCFEDSEALRAWEPLKIWIFLLIALVTARSPTVDAWTKIKAMFFGDDQ